MSHKNNERIYKYQGVTSIQDFSAKTRIKPIEIIKFFFLKGINTTINSALKEAECKELCAKFNYKFQVVPKEEEKNIFAKYTDFSKEKNLVPCAPVVTIMGHVDHGKTTVLDKIRSSNVANREFGQITQHIGAYQIVYKDQPITFLDTPGHEAFTKMRSMGGKVANIVVLVIAADDGLKPQTIEAIQHALHAKVKLIVFVNKIDRGEHMLPTIKKQLSTHNVLIEEFGGDVMFLTGSAMQNKGIDELLDSIVLIAEMEKYVTTLDSPTIGIIIETNIDKGIGNTATVLLDRGTLKLGDFLVTPSSFCKVKNIVDENKKNHTKLIPATPAKISGFKDLPKTGEKFITFTDESEAKKWYEESRVEKEHKLFNIETDSKDQTLSIILRTDVSGTLDAIKHLIEKVDIKIIASGVGPINDADIQLATISSAMLINFNQKISPGIEASAKSNKILIKSYKSIYQIEEDLVLFKEQNRFVEKIEQILGTAKVLKLWHHSKVGTIAGCIVESGKINIKNKVKVIRGNEIIAPSATIKTFKTEAFEIKEAKENNECGIVLQNHNDIKVGDLIQAFEFVDKT